ncbi:hypothetical protein [Cellvibrio sp. PSBB006]|jgi:hypothetical protein|uniref:hypothetical protein n=1 Tax=Cellvibrio sp. PSBB006 TaxID=1987723 RepID=UPI000B3B64A6|nr:hypothetical protein [Cellvibrio sp. PSBB006]ARU28464.1 hypothetical protein CBR65_14020 [Cellvibrio sp. PSBB006]HTF84616.1 hypothetical protein [Cellvibrio sp.]
MNKNVKLSLKGLVAGLLAMSAVAQAGSETYQYPWWGNPYAYTSVRDCTWTFITSYGGSWGSQFLYESVGACPWTDMQVNHPAGANYANVVLIN